MGGSVGVAEAGIHGDEGIGADLFAELDEFVGAEVVVLDSAPGGVSPRWTAVSITDSVAPVVAAHKVSAGPAVDRSAQFLELHKSVAAHAFDVVGGHDGEGSEGDGAAFDSDRNGHFITSFVSLELVGELCIATGFGVDGCGFGAEGNGDFGGSREGLEPDGADVLFTGEGAETVLADFGPVGKDGGVAADEDVLLRHFNLAAIDLPGRSADAGEVGVFHRDIGRVGGFDGVEEFAIFEHFSPDAAVDATAEVLDELAVDIGIDCVPSLCGVYRDAKRGGILHGKSLGCHGDYNHALIFR